MADFHAADLWVAVIPDTKQVGPAMEKAGKEAKDKFGGGVKDFGKTIIDDLEKVKAKTKDVFSDAGSHAGDAFKNAGKKASESFSTEFKTGAKDLGKVLLEEYGPVLGEELGKAIGGKIGDALHDLPGMDAVRDVVDKVAEHGDAAADAFQKIRDAINATKTGDYSTALKGVEGALHSLEPVAKEFGIDIGGWDEHLKNVTGGLEATNSIMGGIKDKDFGKTVGGISDALKIAEPYAQKMGIDLKGWEEPLGVIGASTETFVTLKGGVEGLTAVVPALGTVLAEVAGPLAAIAAAALAIKEAYDWGTAHVQADMSNPANNPQLPNLPVNPPGSPNAGQPRPGTVAPPLPPGWEVGPGGIPIRKKAGGGALEGPGQVGKDSILMWGAPGEHMVTADEVAGAGGHQQVHAVRALMKAGFFKNIRGYDKGGGLNTYGAQVDTIAIAEAIQKLFGINDIGMYRAADAYPEHPSGEAADVMVGQGNVGVGNAIKDYALKNASAYDVLYCLWQQRQWNPDGSSSGMEDRGSPTANHRDHVHIRTAGGGYPKGGQPAGAPSPSGTKGTPAPAVAAGQMPGIGSAQTASFGGADAGGGAGGGGGGGGGDAGGGAGGGGSGAGEQGKQFGAGIVGGVLQATGLDGSVFKSFTGKGPMDWGITKLAGGLIGELTKTSTKPGGAGPPGAGGILGGLIGSLPGGEAISALAQAAQPGGAAGGAAGGTTNIDNSFTVNGVGSVPEQKQAANAYQAQVAAAPVNP